MTREAPEENTSIGSDSWFGIGLGLCQETEKVVVEYSIGQLRGQESANWVRTEETRIIHLWCDEENRFDRSFTNHGNYISKSSLLEERIGMLVCLIYRTRGELTR